MVDINCPFLHPCAVETVIRTDLDVHIGCQARTAIFLSVKDREPWRGSPSLRWAAV